MLHQRFAGLVLCSLTLAAQAAWAAPDAQSLLAASDAIRNPDKSFSLSATLLEYRGGKQVDSNTLLIYSRLDPKDGQFRTLVNFVAPARDTGKRMLKNGNDMWFYDPASQATVRISPEQRLLGQAANGDVATANLARDYSAQVKEEEDVSDGDRKTRHAYRLELAAIPGKNQTYHHIDLWLDTRTSAPIKAKFFSESGRLLKTALYRRWRDELGVQRPTETVIIDGLDTNWVTVMRFDQYAWRDVPEAWLQSSYLPRFKPE